ncbi:hypothetical protein [Paramuribaculum intestinale]|uniref:hypothetical protein n=8 Tax=Paramuribaculum intestinale TaxID=2094151 RepID=UPI000FFF060C|nr:hypothetical protein [Paramuribaculum intestinale]RXE62650.1 hypothetical protein ED375_03965 [Muribaculaceae bacterium Isolate-004 (NCI)]
MVTGVRSGGWAPMRDSGSVTIRSVDPGQERTTHSAASPGGHEPATWRQHREKSGSRGACGEMTTGVRSGGWTPMRDSGSVTIRGVDPGQERTTHSAASPGGHEPATWRQHREEEEERERSKAIGKNHRSHQIAPMTPTIL